MTEREALKLALEALEAHADIGIKSDKAITAIKEALAQQEQEPVALVYDPTTGSITPLQRTWVGLTDEEVLDMARTFGAQPWPPNSCAVLGKMIEAKLKEKNSA